MSDFTEAQWARGGVKARARAEAVRRPLRRAIASAIEKGLDGVTFASKTARTLAEDAGLGWPDFLDVSESAAGGYTAGDVRAVIGGQRG